MLDKPLVSEFSHVKPAETPWRSDGLRDFFLYRDLGMAAATGGRVIAQLVKANVDRPPEHGTGWHRHVAEWHMVLMTKGWAKFMYEDKVMLVEAGDCMHQRPGIVHYLHDHCRTWSIWSWLVPPSSARWRRRGPARCRRRRPGSRRLHAWPGQRRRPEAKAGGRWPPG